MAKPKRIERTLILSKREVCHYFAFLEFGRLEVGVFISPSLIMLLDPSALVMKWFSKMTWSAYVHTFSSLQIGINLKAEPLLI